MKEFDYYIYIDYSEGLIGYTIIKKEKVKELLPRISKFHHYKNLKHKREYLNSIKKRFERDKIKSYLLKWKIRDLRENLDVFVDVVNFVKENNNCLIFVSVDDNQFRSFKKLVQIADGKFTVVVKESGLRKGTSEYQMSLIIDTMLNLERRKRK